MQLIFSYVKFLGMGTPYPRFEFNTQSLRWKAAAQTLDMQSGSGVEAVKTFLMVGATVEEGSLSFLDSSYLKIYIELLDKQGIPVSETIDVHVCNLDYGHDFLESVAPADVCSFNFIYYRPVERVFALSPYTRQSLMCAEKHLWHKSLLKTGARIAFNVYSQNDDELPTRMIERPPYERVATYYKFFHYDMLLNRARVPVSG